MGKNVSNEEARPVMQRMYDYIRANKVSQTEIAREILGGTPDYMNDRLTCKRQMTVAEYIAICDYLHVKYDSFMQGGKCEKCGKAINTDDISTAIAPSTHLLCGDCYMKYRDYMKVAADIFFKKGEE